MASEEGLKILLKAEVQDFLKDMKAAGSAVTGAASSATEAVKSFLGLSSAAGDASKALNEEAAAANKSGQANASVGRFIRQMTYERKAALIEMRNGTNGWKLEAKAIQDVSNNAMPAFQRSVKGGTSALTAFGRIVQDAPYGVIGIGNNITQFAEQFQYLRQRTGSAGSAISALVSSLAGAGGLTLGISFLTSGITALVQKYGSLSNAIHEITGSFTEQQKAQKAVSESLKGADSEYTKAVTNVSALKNEIELAKNGFIDKDKVVKHYNDTIGKTTGSVKSLDEAEKALQKNAEAYIRFTLLKAAANQALEAAAKKAFEAELERSKSDEESTSYILSGLANSTDSSVQNLYKKAAARNRKLASDEAEKDRATLEDIAKKFEEQAAAISKTFNFDFFGGDQNEKGKKTKTISDVLKELDQQITAVNAKFAATGGTAKQIGTELQNAYEKALEALSKLGITTDSLIFKNIKSEVDRIQQFVNAQTLNLGRPTLTLPITIVPDILPSTQLSNIKGLSDKFAPQLNSLTKQINNIIETSIEGGIVDLSSAFGSALVTGDFGNIAKAFATSIGGFMQQMGEALVATGIGLEAFKKSLESFQGVPAIIAGVGLIAAGAAFKSLVSSGVPAFATGGTVSGPTLAMVGDNPSGVEHIIPQEVLDRLGGGNEFVAETRLSGSDILISVKRAGLNQNRING